MCSSKANEELVSKLTESVAATSRQSGTSTRRARVIDDISEAWTGGVLTRTRQQQCMEAQLQTS